MTTCPYRLVAAMVVGLGGAVTLPGCRTTNPAPAPQISYAHVVEEFSLDQPTAAWKFRTPARWQIGVEGQRRFLHMLPGTGRPDLPGPRRPQEYAVYAQYVFHSFNLSCRVRAQAGPESPRDICVVFGRQDSTHMYVLTLSDTSDAFHNNISRIDGDTATPLIRSPVTLPVAVTDGRWHKLDIIRDADSGVIRVYLDAVDEKAVPVFDVTDKTYPWGHIAFGTYDDRADFARLLIEGQARSGTPKRAQ